MTYCIKCRIINIFHFFIFCLRRRHCCAAALFVIRISSSLFGFSIFVFNVLLSIWLWVSERARVWVVSVHVSSCMYVAARERGQRWGVKRYVVWLLFFPSLHFVNMRSKFKMLHTVFQLYCCCYCCCRKTVFHILHRKYREEEEKEQWSTQKNKTNRLQILKSFRLHELLNFRIHFDTIAKTKKSFRWFAIFRRGIRALHIYTYIQQSTITSNITFRTGVSQSLDGCSKPQFILPKTMWNMHGKTVYFKRKTHIRWT